MSIELFYSEGILLVPRDLFQKKRGILEKVFDGVIICNLHGLFISSY